MLCLLNATGNVIFLKCCGKLMRVMQAVLRKLVHELSQVSTSSAIAVVVDSLVLGEFVTAAIVQCKQSMVF